MDKTKWLWPLLLAASPTPSFAQEAELQERAALHFQSTVATQAHPAFGATYSGRNSLSSDAESATSVVMDFFGGVRLWSGAEVWLEPELAGGRGLSTTLGVAAFPSGEVYRVGDPSPTVIPGRLFVRQTIGLGGLIQSSVTTTKNRIPLLGDIPGLGVLFGSTSYNQSRTELIVLLTPHIIKSSEEANDATRQLREGLLDLRKGFKKDKSLNH